MCVLYYVVLGIIFTSNLNADCSSVHQSVDSIVSVKGKLQEQDDETNGTSMQFTTKVLSAPEVARRLRIYTVLIVFCASFVIALAVLAHIYKTKKLEIPILKCRNGHCPPFAIESEDVLERIKACFPTRQPDLARHQQENSLQATSLKTEEMSSQMYTRVSSSDNAIEQQEVSVRAQFQHEENLSTEPILKQLEEMKQRDYHVQLWKRVRRYVLTFLLAAYMSVCIVFPLLSASHASCHNGFFWEDHAPFGFTFIGTKLVEITFYAFDPSLDGQLVLWKFLLLFLPSFIGYIDAYQDYTSTVLAHACAADPTAHVNHALADHLAISMTWSFWIGVFFAQWIGVGYLALFKDGSLAVLAKLVHMDALAMCISIEEDSLWMMRAVNLVRTFGEDIPQAIQQTIYVLYVKVNVFMVLSIVISVGCSFKAVYDAIKRASSAAGYLEQLRKYEEEALAKITQARKAGDSLQKLKNDGYDPKLLSRSGVTLGELMEVFTPQELIDDGFSAEEVEDEAAKTKEETDERDVDDKDEERVSFYEEEEKKRKKEENKDKVAEIRIRSGDLIDQIVFVYSDGAIEKFGREGGEQRPAFVLNPGEVITKIDGSAGDLLDSVKFVTSSGRESMWYGNPRGGRPFSMEAAPGNQIWSIERPEGHCRHITGIVERPR